MQGAAASVHSTAISLKHTPTALLRLSQVAVLAGCQDCGGSGAAAGTAAHLCELCRGAGEILKNRRVNGYGGLLAQIAACLLVLVAGIAAQEQWTRHLQPKHCFARKLWQKAVAVYRAVGQGRGRRPWFNERS